MNSAEYYIEKLKMEPHVEGGYFNECLQGEEIPEGTENRSLWSSIYFLLEEGNVSHLHSLKSDEVWYYHAGNPLTIYMISPQGELTERMLGLDVEKGQQPQVLVPRGSIFGAAMEHSGFSLVGCMVAPAFCYEEFDLKTRAELLERYPQHARVIRKLTVADK